MISTKFSFAQKIYKPLFEALDFESKGLLHIEQFFILSRCLLKEKFSQEKALVKFDQIADVQETENKRKNLSFKAFTSYMEREAKTDDIFRWETVESTTGHCKNIQELENNWNFRKNLVKLRYLQNGQYGIIHQRMISTIEDYMKSSLTIKGEYNEDIIWYRYKFLDYDGFERYLRSVVYSYLPDELVDFNFNMHKLKKK
jgi:hypothetical protein